MLQTRREEHTVHVEERLQGVILRVVVRSVRVSPSQTVRVEVSAVLLRSGDLWAKLVDREIVSPNLTVVRALEDLSFEGRLAVDTCAVRTCQHRARSVWKCR